MNNIQALADQWLALDREDETHREISQLVEEQDHVELERRLRTRIAFGTAGLRSVMKAGFAHMNSLNVLTTSIGLARYINSYRDTISGRNPSIVIGYDGRYRSRRFARQAAAAFLESGFNVLWFDRLVHTPLVPFSVVKYKASAGVMITASHNPKNDNGYKVYWDNGSQIIPPHDVGIAAAIDKVDDIFGWDEAAIEQDQTRVHNIFDEAHKAYLESLVKVAGTLPDAE